MEMVWLSNIQFIDFGTIFSLMFANNQHHALAASA